MGEWNENKKKIDDKKNLTKKRKNRATRKFYFNQIYIQICADVVDTIIKLFTILPTLNERNFTEILVYQRIQSHFSAMTAFIF
jgi:uncharacterized protein YutE (UPF0331/DUF86 family)